MEKMIWAIMALALLIVSGCNALKGPTGSPIRSVDTLDFKDPCADIATVEAEEPNYGGGKIRHRTIRSRCLGYYPGANNGYGGYGFGTGSQPRPNPCAFGGCTTVPFEPDGSRDVYEAPIGLPTEAPPPAGVLAQTTTAEKFLRHCLKQAKRSGGKVSAKCDAVLEGQKPSRKRHRGTQLESPAKTGEGSS